MKIKDFIAGHVFAKIKRLRCSFGVCQHEVSLSQKDLLLRADKALYKAKASGRNCICTYAGSSGYIVLNSGMENGDENRFHSRNDQVKNIEHESVTILNS